MQRNPYCPIPSLYLIQKGFPLEINRNNRGPTVCEIFFKQQKFPTKKSPLLTYRDTPRRSLVRRFVVEERRETTMSGKAMQRAFLVELVSKLELLSWSSVQPRDSGRHVKENKRSILDGPFVEGLARGFYVHTEREGERGRGRRANRDQRNSCIERKLRLLDR